jgi:hypothetical protein
LTGLRPGSVGLGRIWAGLARSGPGRPGHVSSLGCATSCSDFKRSAGPCARLMVNRQVRSMGFARGPRWSRSTLISFPSAHGAPSASSSSSAQFFPCFLCSAALSPAASGGAYALVAQRQKSRARTHRVVSRNSIEGSTGRIRVSMRLALGGGGSAGAVSDGKVPMVTPRSQMALGYSIGHICGVLRPPLMT